MALADNYTDEDSILDIVGITVDKLPDGYMDRVLPKIDAQVDRYIRSTCKPTLKLEQFTGESLDVTIRPFVPIMNIQKLEINDTDITIDSLSYKKSGEVQLTQNSEVRYYNSSSNSQYPDNVVIKYQYAWLENTIITDSNLKDESSGSSVEIEILDASQFEDNDYIMIEGFDKNWEITKIISRNETTNTITCNLNVSHEAGSIISRVDYPDEVKTLATWIGAIFVSEYMIGNTYTFATSVTQAEYSTTFGVPYTHFRDVLKNAQQERDKLLDNIGQWAVFS